MFIPLKITLFQEPRLHPFHFGSGQCIIAMLYCTKLNNQLLMLQCALEIISIWQDSESYR